VVLVLFIAIGAVLAGGWWYANRHPEWWFWAQDELEQAMQELGLEAEAPPPGLVASGFIEAEEASVTTELGGRIVALYAGEGDEVSRGQVVAELDDSLLLAQIEGARSDLALAQAHLAQVEASVRPETLDHALALLHQAQTAHEAALVAWEDARAMAENPQDLRVAVTEARAQLAVLDAREEQALAMANSAQTRRDLANEIMRMIQDFEPFNVSVGDQEFRAKLPADIRIKARQEQAEATYQAWEAWAGAEQAEAARIAAEEYLAELARRRNNPLTLEAQAHAAGAQVQIAASAVAVAQAQVDALQIGATPEQVAAVAAQVEVARAAVAALEVQLDKLTLVAPISGLVLERPVHVGELALPGAPLLTLADLENLTLTVYVPEAQLGQVQIGQPVSVTVDAYPGRAFMGNVTFIASEAEFTPKNVQTREERVNMVFAVKVGLPNPDHSLKPGMPADAVLLKED
jgi:multidrug efflux pump subunit AcrA (membrane-fusion protein)